jgi:glycosyltransferase involved in cell wall biosynthesis
MHSTHFSLIVPTRERLETLRYCLQTITSQSYENLEIIVSDNASTDGTQEYVSSLSDRRIRYINTGQRVGMSQNWEFALKHAKGEWVSFLGDDDGLMPNCFEKINSLIAQTKAKAIRTRACSYIWPNAQPLDHHLAMNIPLGKRHSIRKSSVWIDKVLTGSRNYSELPMIYNGGFVQKTILDQFAQAHGQVFFSRIPDVYSGLLIAHMIDDFVYSSEPVVINGTSASSTGFAYFKKASVTNESPLTINPHTIFTQEKNLAFHASIPLMRDGDIPKSLQAMIFESYAQVADRIRSVKRIESAVIAQRVVSTHNSMTTEQLRNWMSDYRATHHLPENSPRPASKWQKMLCHAQFMWYRLSILWPSYFLNTQKMHIGNIYEASIAAGEIHTKQPLSLTNFTKNTFGLLMRKKFAASPKS